MRLVERLLERLVFDARVQAPFGNCDRHRIADVFVASRADLLQNVALVSLRREVARVGMVLEDETRRVRGILRSPCCETKVCQDRRDTGIKVSHRQYSAPRYPSAKIIVTGYDEL